MKKINKKLFSKKQVQQYRSEGYLIAESLIDALSLKQIKDAILEVTDKALCSKDHSQILEFEPNEFEGKRIPRRIYSPYFQHKYFQNLGCDNRILDRIELLIGKDIQIQHSKLNMKPAKVGSVVEWHQDLTYFPHTNDDLVTTLIYLDDATIENGCLQVLPKKHHRFLNHSTKEGNFAGMVTEKISKAEHGVPVPLEGKAGTVIFMHCMLPHSSLPNKSEKDRGTLIFEYRAADSFPIFFGELVSLNESKARQVRGNPASFARFGKISPMIPKLKGKISSLYDLQSQAKNKII